MRFSKPAALAAVAALAAAPLVGCSNVLDPGSTEAITVYSNSLSDGRSEWLDAKAKEAGFNLQFVDIGGGDVYNRLVAEKSNPVASVTFGLNDIYYQKLLEEGVLEEYTPAWADKVDQDKVDPSKTFWPIVREPIMLVCNKAAYPTPADGPQDWPDLWQNPKFEGKYEVPASLGGATTQVVISGILSRFPDPSGNLGVSDEGWDAIGQYFQKGSRSVEGTDLYARMKSGDVNCGQMWLAGKAVREKQYGISTYAVHPKNGVPMVRQYVALIKNGKNPEKAKEFIDWFGSAEIQGAWSKEFFTAPENTDAAALGSSEAIEVTDSFKEQDIDWAFVATNLDKWIEEIQLKFVK